MKKILFIIFLLIISGCASQAIPSVETTKCIAQNSVLYVSQGCIHCVEQEKLFGENYQYLITIDCKLEPKKCLEAEITGTPTWIINGSKLVGVQDIETLKRVTNCA